MPREIRGVENQKNRVGAGKPVHFAEQDIVSDTLVIGARLQAVDTRKVDGKDLASRFDADLT